MKCKSTYDEWIWISCVWTLNSRHAQMFLRFYSSIYICYWNWMITHIYCKHWQLFHFQNRSEQFRQSDARSKNGRTQTPCWPGKYIFATYLFSYYALFLWTPHNWTQIQFGPSQRTYNFRRWINIICNWIVLAKHICTAF